MNGEMGMGLMMMMKMIKSTVFVNHSRQINTI